MTLSQAALQAVLAESTSEAFLYCLTLTHPELDTLRLVNDRVDLVRTEGTFMAFPFQVLDPPQDGNEPPRGRIRIDNVDQRVILALRSIAGSREDLTVRWEEVLASSPNTIEAGPIEFRAVGAPSITPGEITIELEWHAGLLTAAFPARQFAPSNAT